MDLSPCKGIRIPESAKFLPGNPKNGKILLMESGILGFGIRNTVQFNQESHSDDWNPESKFH